MQRQSTAALLAACTLFLAGVGLGEPAPTADDATGRVTVETVGYKKDKGDALISLANSRAVFESDKEVFRSAAVPVAGGKATAVFDDLPYGEYAVKVFHDANQNRKLDFGMMGPKEAYGFSNNARGTFGPPDYDETKFSFETGQLTVEIDVK